jgi:hypothetical protein
VIADELNPAERRELVELLVESSAARIHAAVNVIAGAIERASTGERVDSPKPPAIIDWLLYLDALCSGDAFERALLKELRRLSIH